MGETSEWVTRRKETHRVFGVAESDGSGSEPDGVNEPGGVNAAERNAAAPNRTAAARVSESDGAQVAAAELGHNMSHVQLAEPPTPSKAHTCSTSLLSQTSKWMMYSRTSSKKKHNHFIHD